MDPTVASAREIVRRSGSNLAFALAVLPRAKREAMEVFYAFCRLVDDLADDPGIPMGERRASLERWRSLVRGEGTAPPRPGIETEFRALRRNYPIRTEDLEAILDGVAMDLVPQRFATVTDLDAYCYRVACAVGLASIEIFGYTDPAARDYARELGYALQWTNILRDVGEDAAEGRLYLPLEELRRFGLDEAAILSGKPDRAKFGRLMKRCAAIARARYREAEAALPKADRSSMRSAELMRRIYSGILEAMERDGFRVFEKRYRLPKPTMFCEFLRAKYLG